MFFVLSKVLDVLTAPLTWPLLLLAASMVPRLRARRLGRYLVPAALATLVVFSLEPVAYVMVRACENPPLTKTTVGPPYDAVVLLGGLLDEDVTAERARPEFNQNVDRLLATFDLLRTDRARVVIISAGPWRPRPPAEIEGEVLARVLEGWGIARERIIVESRSRNTRENAAYTAEIVRDRMFRRLLLVTSAFHMPRAYGCFRAVALDPDTLPVDFRKATFRFEGRMLLPRADALVQSSEALRELTGRLVYRIRGFTRTD